MYSVFPIITKINRCISLTGTTFFTWCCFPYVHFRELYLSLVYCLCVFVVLYEYLLYSYVYLLYFMCICCTSYKYLLYLMCICCTMCVLLFLLQMPDCWLGVSIRKVLRLANSTQVFLVSLCLQANAEMVPKFPSCYYMPLMQPSRLKFPSQFFFHICLHVK